MLNPGKLGRIYLENWKNYPEHYTNCLWPEELPTRPKDYGSNDFHGRTHPEIIKVALERYTKPGDIVWDPMAGSGTTIDVCKEFECVCIASDLTPTRIDIMQADAEYWYPDKSVDLVILHPPYMNIVKYSNNHTSDLSNMEYVNFLDKMYNIFQNIDKALKIGHVMVVIVGSIYGNISDSYKETIALDAELLNLVCGNYRLLGRIFRTYGETKGGETAGKKNENLWKYRRLKNGIWSLGVETILFLQRVN